MMWTTFQCSLREKCSNTEFSGAYFPVFRQNTGKYGPGKTPCLDNFHAVVTLFVYLFHVTFGIFVLYHAL